MAKQPSKTWQLPPPITSPFAASFPVELQNIDYSPKATPTSPLNGRNQKIDAWKFEGYREFSKWMASDDDFFIIRRFQSLNANVILYMQDRISQIEGRLKCIHEENEKAAAPAPGTEGGERRNSSFRWDMRFEPERDRLMCELTSLLHHYNQYIETFSKIRQRAKAEDRQIQNVEVFKKRCAIREAEMNFLSHKHDLISINPQVTTPLQRFLENFRVLRLGRFMRAKVDPSYQSVSGNTHYADDKALMNLSSGSIILLGLGMLLGPIWWLEYVSDSEVRLAIITVFLAVFTGLMTAATVNQPFQVVASSAAYAAVLMVFMQIENK